MRSYFSLKPQLWLGGIMLAALVIIVPVMPALALPVNSYDLSGGPYTGSVSIESFVGQPFVAWNITDTSSVNWNNINDVFQIANFVAGPTTYKLTTVNSSSNLLFFTAFLNPLDCVSWISTVSACYGAQGPNVSGFGPLSLSNPVPEPSVILLLATGLLGLAGARWWQHRQERTQVG